MSSDNKTTRKIKTYKDVGIDIGKIKDVQKNIGKSISSTFKFLTIGKVLSGYGHYAGLIEIDGKILSIHTDGVGTKILVAQQMEKFDTIGIDCMAMNINDIVCVGSKPLGYLSYVALQNTNDHLLKEITKGLVLAAKLSNVAIIGGETAILPDIITGKKEKYNFDLAGMILGIVDDKRKLILGNKIKSGDVIIGINSSGLHSNGYTLARKILLDAHDLDEKPEHLQMSVGEELLRPTTIYSKTILNLIQVFDGKIHGLAHITGGSFTKLGRLNSKFNYVLDDMPPIEGIFKQIMEDGGISIAEMYKTFNMGIGFCVIAPKQEASRIIDAITKDNLKARIVGKVKPQGKGISFLKHDGKLVKLLN
ncbi:MAG: phosphoribosylformylglycinamidine cyclo-ligase [Thermoproteota archaeon]|nr:phosphoribosylformylglycinamidine cyclo-ligase [Thermoproteota archaeon]